MRALGRTRWIALGIVVALLLTGAACSDDDGGGNGAQVASTTTTTPARSDPSVMWPFPGSTDRYDTPAEAARSFATEFLGFTAPVVEEFRQGDARSGEVRVRPRRDGPATTILVRQTSGTEAWSVLGATTEGIQLTSPTGDQPIMSPVQVMGRARTFEGTVQVEVRADGSTEPIGAGVVTAGGDIMLPFAGSISFETAGVAFGAVVFFTESAEDGTVWEAAAVRVPIRSGDIAAAGCGAFRSPRPPLQPGQKEVKAYFTCDTGEADGSLHPVYRALPDRPDVLRQALEVLLAGPSPAERDAGLESWFSDATRALVRSVVINAGHAIVDFGDLRPVIPNASTSAGSQLLLSQLDATVFQFDSVSTVEYRLVGSCAAFTEWLQSAGCDPRSRPPSDD